MNIDDKILADVTSVAESFSADGQPRRERRHLEEADFKLLADAGLNLTGVPTAQGGLWKSPQASVRAYCELYRTLARHDPSVALVTTMHPSVLAFWLHAGKPPAALATDWHAQLDEIITNVQAGHWFGTIASEPGTNGDLFASRVAATSAGDGTWRISGDKHMGSGSGITSFMLTVARDEGEEAPDVFLLDTRGHPWDGSTGMQLTAEWDGIGMAATQSHAFRFDEMPANRYAWPGHALTLVGEILPMLSCLFTSVAVGILDSAIASAREMLSPRAEKMRSYERVSWSRAENQYWLAQQAFEGMITAIERSDQTAWAAAHGKLAVAELSESVMSDIARTVGGRSFSRSAPFAQWGQDVRALGFLRPPWPLAHDQLFGQIVTTSRPD